MSWEFVYCPCCGEHQTKIGGNTEEMFCTYCCTVWIEPKPKKKVKKK